MKILQINSVCGVGSTGRIATDLYKVLEAQGHECKIAYGRGTAPQEIDTIKIGSNLDNYCHVFKTRVFDKHGFGSVKATKRFIEQVKEYDPDIIHLHNIHGYYINIEILFNYLKESNKPVVWTLHDCWSFTGHCSHFDYIGCKKWKNECDKCDQKNEYPTSKIIDNSKSNYEIKKELFTSVKNMTIVTPSKWLASLINESFLSKYKVEVINNGIDLNIFTPNKGEFRQKHKLENKFIILGIASVWSKNKGIDYFIDICDELYEDEKIVLVGLTKQQIKKLPKQILGIGKTENITELAEIYSTSNVFVNPTLQDTFPTTNLEALACGTPVITFNTGGSVESVNRKCGIIVSKGNTKGLVDSIRRIKLKSLNENICIEESKKFNKLDRYNDYISLYNIILEQIK